ncbi:MAG TPA: DUF4840 domain-containing protein [Prevotella sp.]
MKTTIFHLLIGILCMASVTSCLNSNDAPDSGLSAENIQTALRSMHGSYSGEMKWVCGTDSGKVAHVNWKVDSLITIQNFPAAVIAHAIASGNENVRAMLGTAAPQELKVYFNFYHLESSQYIFVTETPTLKFSYTANGVTHNATMEFAKLNLASVFLPVGRQMGCVVAANSLMVDNTFININPIYFYFQNAQ